MLYWRRFINMKKVIAVVFCSIILITKVNALECDNKELSRLKKFASLISFETKYIGEKSEDEYGIFISNVTDDFVIYLNNKTYTGNQLIDGLSPNKKYRIEVAVFSNNPCASKFNYVRFITIPYYNKYYNSEVCSNKKIDLCDITYNVGNISYDQFKKMVEEYDNKVINDVVVETNNKKYYFIVIPVFLIIFGLIVLILKKRHK